MKKTLLSLFFIAASFVAFSQLTIDTSGVDVDGANLEYTFTEINTSGNYKGDVYVEITNTGSSDVDFQVRRTNQSVSCGQYYFYVYQEDTITSGHQMCLGVQCFPGDVIPSATGTKTLAAGATMDLHVQIEFFSEGETEEFYEVYEKDNEANNLVSFSTHYESAVCNVSVESVANKFGIKTYPNPANNLINFNYSNVINNSYIIIHDITGKRVGNVDLNSNMNTASFNTGKLQSGIYFYNVFIDGVKTKTNKFIVRH